MARPQSRFVCQSCGESFLRWEGQCRACDGWNTLVDPATGVAFKNQGDCIQFVNTGK
jgi:DNA repair protein RadA/Sms